jgi:hypothetical protein
MLLLRNEDISGTQTEGTPSLVAVTRGLVKTELIEEEKFILW